MAYRAGTGTRPYDYGRGTRGTTGDAVTSSVDDYNVDSRSPIGVGDKFSGNDDPKKHPHIRGNAMAQGQATLPVR